MLKLYLSLLRTPLKKCSLTADDGASSNLKYEI